MEATSFHPHATFLSFISEMTIFPEGIFWFDGGGGMKKCEMCSQLTSSTWWLSFPLSLPDYFERWPTGPPSSTAQSPEPQSSPLLFLMASCLLCLLILSLQPCCLHYLERSDLMPVGDRPLGHLYFGSMLTPVPTGSWGVFQAAFWASFTFRQSPQHSSCGCWKQSS